jgi:hypothetical protein
VPPYHYHYHYHGSRCRRRRRRRYEYVYRTGCRASVLLFLPYSGHTNALQLSPPHRSTALPVLSCSVLKTHTHTHTQARTKFTRCRIPEWKEKERTVHRVASRRIALHDAVRPALPCPAVTLRAVLGNGMGWDWGEWDRRTDRLVDHLPTNAPIHHPPPFIHAFV